MECYEQHVYSYETSFYCIKGKLRGHYVTLKRCRLEEKDEVQQDQFSKSLCKDICDKVFNAALGNKDNKLNKLSTEANKAPYLLRNPQHFAFPKWKTDRFKNTFILSSCLKYN